MTDTQLVERHIVQSLLQNRNRPRRRSLTERFITGLALAACLALLLLHLPGLLWLILAAALVICLGV